MNNLIRFPARPKPVRAPDTRARIERALVLAMNAVDALVVALDEIDGDPDLEDDGDAEPSLGAPENHHGSQVVWLRGNGSDLEEA